MMVVACVALAGPESHGASAQQQVGEEQHAAAGDRAPCAETAVARLPRSAELIVVVDDAAGARHGELMGAVRAVLGPMPELEKTWAGLSRDLGWAAEEAFDRLLGYRVVLVARGLGEEGRAAEWALISEISLETDLRLLDRLEAAPKDIVAGHAMLAVEGGRYRLALHRAAGGAGQGAERRSTAILGPADAPGMLADLIAVVAGEGPASMAGTPACAAVVKMGAASAVLLHRDGASEWENYTIVSLRREGEGRWAADLAVRDATLRTNLLHVPATGSAGFEALAEGALAAAMEVRMPEEGDTEGSRPLGTLLLRLGVPDELRAQLGARQAAVVREVEGRSGKEGRGVAVAVAVEVRDVAETASLADRYGAAVCAALDPEAGPPPQFDGIAPAAVRKVPVSSGASFVGNLAGGTGEAEVAWVIAPSPVRDGGGGGWWVMGAGPAGEAGAASAVRGLAGCVAAEYGKEPSPRRWLTRGVVRPARLAEALPSRAARAMIEAARSVGEVRWAAEVTDEGEIRGRVTIERAASEPGAGGR